MIKTPLTAMLDIEHPIVCGGMSGLGTAMFVAAVADAGALAFLTAVTQPIPDGLAREIAKTKEVTQSHSR